MATDKRNFMMWADFRAEPQARIRGALEAATARGMEPALVLVALGEAADIAGVEVREPRAGEGVVAKGTCWVSGRAE